MCFMHHRVLRQPIDIAFKLFCLIFTAVICKKPKKNVQAVQQYKDEDHLSPVISVGSLYPRECNQICLLLHASAV